MSYENVCIREAIGAEAPNHDDACMVCDKIECVCAPEVAEKRNISIEQWIESIDRENARETCSECGGPMISVYHRRGSLLPICALCAAQCGQCWKIDCKEDHEQKRKDDARLAKAIWGESSEEYKGFLNDDKE